MSRDILNSCIIFPYNFFFDSLKLISWSWWFGVLVNVGSCGRLENLGLVLEMCIRWLPILIWSIAFLTEKLGICLLKEKGQEILAFFCSYLIVSSHSIFTLLDRKLLSINLLALLFWDAPLIKALLYCFVLVMSIPCITWCVCGLSV